MTVTASKCALTEDLAEALDEIEPGSGFGQWDELETGVAPVPQHRLHAPVQRQRIDDQIGVAGRSKALQPIKKLEPCGGITGSGRLDQDLSPAVRQCTECLLRRWAG